MPKTPIVWGCFGVLPLFSNCGELLEIHENYRELTTLCYTPQPVGQILIFEHNLVSAVLTDEQMLRWQKLQKWRSDESH
jgi:hypothetical protein